ncbi:autotransporter outer membrane beta-barrel domain-containing protein [Pragia fontium]|nr:autotransporter outer membrane beta-barrel domain-containing protein [Pragia fontium]
MKRIDFSSITLVRTITVIYLHKLFVAKGNEKIMNKIFTSIYSHSTGLCVVASELAKGKKKSNTVMKSFSIATDRIEPALELTNPIKFLLITALATLSGTSVAAPWVNAIGTTQYVTSNTHSSSSSDEFLSAASAGTIDGRALSSLHLKYTGLSGIHGVVATGGSKITLGNNVIFDNFRTSLTDSHLTIGSDFQANNHLNQILHLLAVSNGSLTLGERATLDGKGLKLSASSNSNIIANIGDGLIINSTALNAPAIDIYTANIDSDSYHVTIGKNAYITGGGVGAIGKGVFTIGEGATIIGNNGLQGGVFYAVSGANTSLKDATLTHLTSELTGAPNTVAVAGVRGEGTVMNLDNVVISAPNSDQIAGLQIANIAGGGSGPFGATINMRGGEINTGLAIRYSHSSATPPAPNSENIYGKDIINIVNTVISSSQLLYMHYIDSDPNAVNLFFELNLKNVDASQVTDGIIVDHFAGNTMINVDYGTVIGGGAINNGTGGLNINVDHGSSLQGNIINNGDGNISGSIGGGGIVDGGLTNNGNGRIDFGINNGGTLRGDVIKNGKGNINLSINEGGIWNGNGRNVNLWLKNNAIYQMANASSSFTRVKMDNNSILDFGRPDMTMVTFARKIPSSPFKTFLSISDMTQTDGGLANIRMSTDLGQGKGDLVSVNGAMTGRYLVDVTNYGVGPSAPNESLRIIQGGVGSSTEVALTGSQYRDAGMYRYHLTADNSGTGYWLVNGDGTGVSHGGGDDDTMKSGNAYNPDGSFNKFIPEDSFTPNPQKINQVSDLARTIQSASVAQTLDLLNQSRNVAQHIDGLRLMGIKGDHDATLWINNFYTNTEVSSDVVGHKFKINTNVTYIGVDKSWDISDNNTLISGIFTGVGTAKNKYRVNNSHGDSDIYTTGIYGMYVHSSGLFADVVAQGYRLKTHDDAYTEQGTKTSYDMNSNAVSLGLDIGQRYALQDSFYVEPSIKLAYLRSGSAKFNTRGISQIKVKKESSDVFQYGLGLNIGKTITTSASDAFVQPYLALTVLKQNVSGGDVKSSGTTMKSDLDGYHFQSNLGVNWQMNKNNSVFTEVNTGSGDKFSNALGVGIGYRYSF